MSDLKNSKTEENLKAAFAGESQANRRYLYFAQKADIEGYNDVAAVFRSTAEGETGHAHGHLEFLEETGDPATGEPIGSTGDNLKAAIAFKNSGLGIPILVAKKELVKIFVESENMDDLVVIKNKVKEFTQSDLDNLIYSGTKKDFKLSGTQYKQLRVAIID